MYEEVSVSNTTHPNANSSMSHWNSVRSARACSG